MHLQETETADTRRLRATYGMDCGTRSGARVGTGLTDTAGEQNSQEKAREQCLTGLSADPFEKC